MSAAVASHVYVHLWLQRLEDITMLHHGTPAHSAQQNAYLSGIYAALPVNILTARMADVAASDRQARAASQKLTSCDVAELVNTLVLAAPPGVTYNLKKVEYQSEAGRRSKARFSNVAMPAPMLFSANAGLVLYERILTTQRERELLNKLAKPKVVNKRNAALLEQTTGAAQAVTSPTQHQGVATVSSTAGATAAPTGSISRHPAGSSPATSAATTSSIAGAGTATSYAARSRTFAQQQRGQELKDSDQYFKRERAQMTASSVFTWGGRFKHTPPDPALSSREYLSVGQRRPPLRL